jgi:hypothetical protein
MRPAAPEGEQRRFRIKRPERHERRHEQPCSRIAPRGAPVAVTRLEHPAA